MFLGFSEMAFIHSLSFMCPQALLTVKAKEKLTVARGFAAMIDCYFVVRINGLLLHVRVWLLLPILSPKVCYPAPT